MQARTWQVGAGFIVFLAVALPLGLWSYPSSPVASGPWLVPVRSDAASRPSFGRLVRRYSEMEDACDLPDVGQVLRWHGLELATDPAGAPEQSLPPEVATALRTLDTKMALSRPARAGRPWVLMLPEVHEHEESEAYVLGLARAAARAFGVGRVRIFVEAWSQEVQVDRGGIVALGFSGLEPKSVYPWSRAAWGLLDVMRANQGRADPVTIDVARQALLRPRSTGRLRVGQHRSREAAKRALALYTRAWNVLCARFDPQTTTRARLPLAADYLQDSHWVELDQEAELMLPSDPATCRPESPLYAAALTLAAVTSRLRTTEFALRVLETMNPPDAELVLLQTGANHVFPLVDLLERAGWGWVILLSPNSGKWIDREYDWRCPVSSLPRPLRTGLGYYRLPANRAVRAGLDLSEVVTLPSPPPG